MNRFIRKAVCLAAILLLILWAPTLPVWAQVIAPPAGNIPETEDTPDESGDADAEVPNAAANDTNAVLGTARVIVNDFTVEGGGIKAGATAKISYHIKNMSTDVTVTSVIVAWWSDTTAPLDFIKTNQAYVPSIAPNEEVIVEFNVRVRAVDLTSVSTIGSSLGITYSAPGQSDRTNNVMIQLPVLHEGSDPQVEYPPMSWQIPSDIQGDGLSNSAMRLLSLAGGGACALGTLLILFLRRIRRRF